ncbi:MAG: sugar phosphate isomerase/epimerase family protein [Gemmatimonadaceae bacterium]
MIDRRTFLHSLGVSVAGASVARRSTVRATRLDRVGLELYSVRDAMQRDPERTLGAVRAIGYSDVELLWSFGNFGRTPRQVRDSLDHEGLKAPSAHIAPEVLLTAWDKSLQDAQLIGHQYLIVPSLPDETTHSLDKWREWADHFNTAGAAARRAGIWLAFHNEPDHMKPIDGAVPYDVFAQRTDPSVVRLQLDIGNMVMGGGDPMLYLKRYVDRYWSFHIKDIVADRSHDVELGHGAVDVGAFLAAVPDLRHKPAYIEQEGSTDSLASAARNLKYLSALDF